MDLQRAKKIKIILSIIPTLILLLVGSFFIFRNNLHIAFADKLFNNSPNSGDKIHFMKDGLVEGGTRGFGDAIIIESNGHYALIDTGVGDDSMRPNSTDVLNYLQSLGVTHLDMVIATHMHPDHIGGMPKIAQSTLVDNNTTLYLRNTKNCTGTQCKNMVSAFKTKNAHITSFYDEKIFDGYQAHLGNFTFSFYNLRDDDGDGKLDTPSTLYSNTSEHSYENLNCLGILLTNSTSPIKTFLSADWEEDNERRYASLIGKVDVLKAGHHGSTTSNSYLYLSTLSPKTTIVTRMAPWSQYAIEAYLLTQGKELYLTGQSDTALTLSYDNSTKGYSITNGNQAATAVSLNDIPEGWHGWYYPDRQNGDSDNYKMENSSLVSKNACSVYINSDHTVFKNGSKTRSGKTYTFDQNGLSVDNIDGATCYDIIYYYLSLDNQSANTTGNQTIYERYGTSFYLDQTLSKTMSPSANKINIPTRSAKISYNMNSTDIPAPTTPTTANYIFDGYYTQTHGSGTQYINKDGYLTSNASTTYVQDNTHKLYANWKNASLKLPDIIKTDYDCKWARNSASGQQYSSGTIISDINSDTTFYAVCNAIPQPQPQPDEPSIPDSTPTDQSPQSNNTPNTGNPTNDDRGTFTVIGIGGISLTICIALYYFTRKRRHINFTKHKK